MNNQESREKLKILINEKVAEQGKTLFDIQRERQMSFTKHALYLSLMGFKHQEFCAKKALIDEEKRFFKKIKNLKKRIFKKFSKKQYDEKDIIQEVESELENLDY